MDVGKFMLFNCRKEQEREVSMSEKIQCAWLVQVDTKVKSSPYVSSAAKQTTQNKFVIGSSYDIAEFFLWLFVSLA